ncbi:MAG TPA: nuclear transport factor 2 family protein [Candidatus Cybelea sp.]
MPRLFAFLGLFVLLVMPMQTRAASDGSQSQLRTLEQTFATAMNAENVDAVMSVYAPGDALFVFDVVGPPSVHFGWDAYRKAFEQMFAAIRGPLHLTMSDLDVEVSGDIGYGRSLQRVSGIHAKGGAPFDYTVRVTDVYRKIGDRWLIVQEHLSLPIDRGTFTPLLHVSFPLSRG